MLVLTRKLQQQVKIGDHITVTILRVKGHTVRIGIDAPRDVRVVRGSRLSDGRSRWSRCRCEMRTASRSSVVPAAGDAPWRRR